MKKKYDIEKKGRVGKNIYEQKGKEQKGDISDEGGDVGGGGIKGLWRSRVPCQHNIEPTFSTGYLVNLWNCKRICYIKNRQLYQH